MNQYLMIVKTNFIKIPKDFQSLDDLSELANNYDLLERLSTSLKNYEIAYIKSYLMSSNEVATYIPDSKHSEYKLHLGGICVTKHDNILDNMVYMNNELNNDNNYKQFMVDTVNKCIYIVRIGVHHLFKCRHYSGGYRIETNKNSQHIKLIVNYYDAKSKRGKYFSDVYMFDKRTNKLTGWKVIS